MDHKQARRQTDNSRNLLRKEYLAALMGGKCFYCGYNKCLRALQFHHTDPTSKSYCISGAGRSKKLEDVIKELGSCVLICANCHAEVENVSRCPKPS